MNLSLYQRARSTNRELNSLRNEGRVLPINSVTTPVAAIYVIFALEIAARVYERLILSSLIARKSFHEVLSTLSRSLWIWRARDYLLNSVNSVSKTSRILPSLSKSLNNCVVIFPNWNCFIEIEEITHNLNALSVRNNLLFALQLIAISRRVIVTIWYKKMNFLYPTVTLYCK